MIFVKQKQRNAKKRVHKVFSMPNSSAFVLNSITNLDVQSVFDVANSDPKISKIGLYQVGYYTEDIFYIEMK